MNKLNIVFYLVNIKKLSQQHQHEVDYTPWLHLLRHSSMLIKYNYLGRPKIYAILS
jgi:hypothetical protein